RPYIPCHDFDEIKNWITDRREHALWCADRFAFPIEKDNLSSVLNGFSEKYKESPFVATDDTGKPVGFFCYSLNIETNEGLLTFVMVDPAERGKGYGKEMIRLALKYAFDITKAGAVQLIVFTANPAARKCYESVGFTERRMESTTFTYGDEEWGRCNMVINKNEQPV
ncbi:MAG: GNAT family N-acetyltransferase, partial [Ruminiclostridium sp.]|nr:GNAT family N-acetyltransferase [Ruminiclostridium sp.]